MSIGLQRAGHNLVTKQQKQLDNTTVQFSSVQSLSHVQFFVTPWTVACKAPLSKGFSRQEYWSGLPCPPPGDLPNPGTEPRSPTLQVDSLPSEPPQKPKNTGVGSLSLLQRIFLTQELKPGSPALQVVSVPAELPWKPQTILDRLMHLKSLRLHQHF